jgi:Protein of unknown function (DUF4232)
VTLRPLRRRGPLAAVLVLALLAAASAAVPARVVTVPRCNRLSLLGELRHPTAGAGSRFATLVLTNTTRHTCTLLGYPSLRLLDRRNRPLATHVVRDHGFTPHAVRLEPGDSARSDLRWGAIPGPGEPQSGACEPAPARLAVAPPGSPLSLVVPWRMGPVCEHGTIDVRPLR